VENNSMTTRAGNLLGEFRLGRQLTSIIQVSSVGLPILLGLLILLSDRVIAMAGSGAPLMALIAGVIFGLTLVNVIELLGGSGEHGGTYILVQETLGGLPAFLTGWGILAGSLSLTAALLLKASDLIFILSGGDIPRTGIALGLAFIVLLLQLLQLLPKRLRTRFGLPFLFTALLAIILLAIPGIDLDSFGLIGQAQTGSMVQSVTWLCAAYIAMEALLYTRRQIRDPGMNLPPALIYTLIAGGLMLFTTILILVGLSGDPQGGTDFVTRLSEKSPLPYWVVGLIAVAALTVAANGCSMVAARQLNSLSREGALPSEFQRIWRQFPLPPILFLTLGILIIPLVIWISIPTLVYLSSGMFLAAMSMSNVAAIYSQRTEPDRRRLFVVPFSPLIPAMAIIANVILIQFLPGEVLLGGAIWILAGIAFYLVYARSHQVEAQLGEIVFGRAEPKVAKRSGYRILVPIGPGEERHMMLSLAVSLAHQLEGEVIPLQIISVPDPLAIEEGRRTAQERNTLFQWSTRVADDSEVPIYPITRLSRRVSEGIIDTAIEENVDLILMPWSMKEPRQGVRIGNILGLVAREAPCDVAVVAYHPNRVREGKTDGKGFDSLDGADRDGPSTDRDRRFRPRRILVPTSGGPHAPLATRLALLLAQEHESQVTAVYVANPNATEEEIAEGERRIEQTIMNMQEQAADLKEDFETTFDQVSIDGQVIQADNVVSGIAQAGQSAHLVLIGASEESLIDQVLFGSIPEQVAQESSSPVIIVKRYRGLPRLWLTRTWNALFQALPTLDNEDQIEVYRSIHRDARPDVDFFVMMALSTLIATYGLFQNSNAVIIGAMLVAPLFSPLLAISLSLVLGNVRLLRVAIETNIKGVSLAIGLAVLLAFIAPFKSLTPEILARSQPNLTDLIIALASGVAGAYAIARKDVAAALPGVAIAAALVPPLGVIGIGLALGELSVAGGGGLLVATNLVAIILAGAVTFLLLGFRPGGQGTRDLHLRRGLIITTGLFLLIAIPLAAVFVRSLETTQTKLAIRQTFADHLEGLSNAEIANPDSIEFDDRGEVMVVTAPLYVQGELPEDLVDSLRADLSAKVNKPIRLRLISIPIFESEP
jgi:uncharacterized hydrophobic protein (TIGR00271 family)